MSHSVLQFVTVCCSAVTCGYSGAAVCVAVFCSELQSVALLQCGHVCVCVGSRHLLHCVTVFSSVLQWAAVGRSVLHCVAVCCSALQCVAVCCSVLQCVAVCCSVLQCVAVCYSELQQIQKYIARSLL